MTTPPPPPLSDRDRTLLRRRARQLRKAHDSLGRGNRRITPEVRRIVEDLARSAEAMGLTALTRSAQGLPSDNYSSPSATTIPPHR